MMNRAVAWASGVAMVVASAALPVAAHEGHDAEASAALEPAKVAHVFDRMKLLAGEWVAAEDGPMFKRGALVSRYVLTGGGTALVDTLFPGAPHEMTTVYHRDGADLALTHYCAGGNQPRMRASAPAAGWRCAMPSAPKCACSSASWPPISPAFPRSTAGRPKTCR